MARPVKGRQVDRLPDYSRFCALSRSGEGHRIVMAVEEYETLRLIDYLELTQEDCARRMGVGRGTVQSLYTSARKKLARFLVEGAQLEIGGGEFVLRKADGEAESRQSFQAGKGDHRMKIAVTYENGEVFQHFGHTSQFKIYETEDGAVRSAEVVDTNGSGHGALAGFLADRGVEVLICGGIGMGAKNALAEAGIRLYPGASGDADRQVEAFLAGTLAYDPDTQCSHHDGHGEGNCKNHGDRSCGGHEGHSCGDHEGHGGHGCGGHEGHGGHGCGGSGEGGCGHH